MLSSMHTAGQPSQPAINPRNTNNAGMLNALPPPGIAIFPHLLSSNPQTLVMKAEAFSRDFTLEHAETGKPFLSVDAESMSMSHRKHVMDPATGKQLCTIRRELWSGSGRYYAETHDDGPRLFEAEKTSTFGKMKYSISFGNACNNGERSKLDFKADSAWNSREGTVYLSGQPVAVVRKGSAFGRKYEVLVAPGLDPFVVVALMISVEDKVSSQRSGAAGAAGGAAGGGGA